MQPVIQALITSHRNIRYQTAPKQPAGREKKGSKEAKRVLKKERERQAGMKKKGRRKK